MACAQQAGVDTVETMPFDTATEALASTTPLPATLDVTGLCRPVLDAHDGEDPGTYAARLLAHARTASPDTRRQCAIGWHGECTDIDGTDGCGCTCHRLLERLFDDNDVLHSALLAIAFDQAEPVTEISSFAAWSLITDLDRLDLTATTAPHSPDSADDGGLPAPVAPVELAPIRFRNLRVALLGTEDAAACDLRLTRLLAALAMAGITITDRLA